MEKVKIWKGFSGYLKYVWKEKRQLYFFGVLFFPAFILANYLQVYLPKMVVQELEEQRTISYLAVTTLGLVLCLMLCTWVRVTINSKLEYGNRMLAQSMQNEFTKKLLLIDYKYLEDKNFLSIRNMTRESLFGGSIGEAQERAKLMNFMTELLSLIAAIGNVLLYIFYLCRLSPWLIIILLEVPLLTVFNMTTVRRAQAETADQAADAWQKIDYVTRKTEDFSMAKDIRLYGMDQWLSAQAQKYCRERLSYKGRELRLRGSGDILGILAYGLYYGSFFACILYRFWQGSLEASDVVFYAGMGPALYQMLDFSISSGVIRLSGICAEFDRFQEYMSYGEDTGMVDAAVQKEAPTITLEHVSFAYPDAGEKVLEDLNLTIPSGEKVAIVGVNGAGKTTLMKLICGLLHPTSGRILLNGKDMEQMEAEERYAWFSCVFQDIQFLPLSIRENVTMETSLDASADAPMDSAKDVAAVSAGKSKDDKIWRCLEQADMKAEVERLPKKLDTLLEKTLHEDAVDFSGGQRQKLILARALYRNAGTLILDEPTAALDALAENDIYEKYAGFAKDKTSFFVSHRLSSTRFCDRILLLDGGSVAEEGTHEELLAAGGLYAGMFALQSKYYKGGAAE